MGKLIDQNIVDKLTENLNKSDLYSGGHCYRHNKCGFSVNQATADKPIWKI